MHSMLLLAAAALLAASPASTAPDQGASGTDQMADDSGTSGLVLTSGIPTLVCGMVVYDTDQADKTQPKEPQEQDDHCKTVRQPGPNDAQQLDMIFQESDVA